MKKYFLFLFLLCVISPKIIRANDYIQHYEKAYLELKNMLEGKTPLNTQKAIFIVENAWYGNTRKFTDFQSKIQKIGLQCQTMINRTKLNQYKTAGNWAIFEWMTQKVPENQNRPCIYNFDDFFGKKDFSSMFVSKLLETKKGNCLSLPLLYMCVAQDIGVEARLTLGPSHAWIRHIDEEGQWANVELTSGQLPTDGLMMTGLGIQAQAIKSGAYLSELTQKEAIAFLLTQLALGYENRTGKSDNFTDKCADLSIKYFPPNVIAYTIKKNRVAKRARKLIINGMVNSTEFKLADTQYDIYEKKLIELGAGELGEKKYEDWMNSVTPSKQ